MGTSEVCLGPDLFIIFNKDLLEVCMLTELANETKLNG